jgi:signal transduction histidine kinase
MAEVSSAFLPVSHLFEGNRIQGLQASWTSQCERCDRRCEASVSRALQICSYGVNYQRVSNSLLLFGFLVRGSHLTQSQAKAFRQNPGSVVDAPILARTVTLLKSDQQNFLDKKSATLSAIVDEYKAQIMFKPDLLELLKPQVRESLSFLHDYRQFVARVTQNINVVLQKRYPGQSIDQQLEQALKEEAAIYWSAKLMEDKLYNTLMLMQPEQLTNAPTTTFRLHGFIHKHFRIYEAAFAEKGVRIYENGRSLGEISAPQAFAAIPHSLLDNALKYSLRGSQVTVSYREDLDNIEFSVTSYGPKIGLDELTKIFEPFQRGAGGIAHAEEGSGIGLYLAQTVARGLGTEIRVRQSQQKSQFGYETVFSVLLKRSDDTRR